MNRKATAAAGFGCAAVLGALWLPVLLHRRPPPDAWPHPVSMARAEPVTDPQPGNWVTDPIAPTDQQPYGAVTDQFSAEAMANVGVSFVPFCREMPDGSMRPDEDSVCLTQRTTAESADYWLHKTVFQQTMGQIMDRNGMGPTK